MQESAPLVPLYSSLSLVLLAFKRSVADGEVHKFIWHISCKSDFKESFVSC
ncbi:hypothetical protein CSC17_0866 [Klebsiella oxytoca]|nr:hypothetical protein CSC17_0866 [Klebsiella oxytoca]